jgi:hypothetical protein
VWLWLFCERAENSAVNQSGHHILNDDVDGGKQRWTRKQRLQNQLADYFLTPAGAVPSQCSYINLIQLIVVEDEN